jgi:membrane protease YdiL (CAAX protease family)
MKTPIGQDLRENGRLRAVYAVLAVVVVSLDIGTIWWQPLCIWTEWNVTLAPLVLLAFVLPSRISRESLGLRLTPIQPIRYWVRFTVIIAAAMLVFILICALIVKALGFEIPVHKMPPDRIVMHLFHACLVAPLVEELIYRFAICVPATAILGPTGAILLSGVVFAGLHFAYGNPGPDNFVAGYILAWAYLKSGSILVPISLHALGNSVAVFFNTLNWYVA